MNIRKLKIFYATANSLNMTKVAKELYISQPSVSQSIHEIETELGVVLFDRIGKRLHLTEEGTIFLNYVRRILNLYEEGTETLKEMAKMEKGKIKIGASTTIGTYILPEIIREFVEEHKKIEISLIIENTANIEKLILENKVDFAFVEGKIGSSEINVKKIWDDELVFICSDNHKWNGKKYIESTSLLEERLIMRERGSGTREIMENYLYDKKIDFKPFMELGNTEAIKKSVEANLGVSCLSKRSVIEKIENGDISGIRIKDKKIKRMLSLIYHKDKFLSNNIKMFMDYAKDY